MDNVERLLGSVLTKERLAELRERTRKNLEGLHPHLVQLHWRADAITTVPYIVTEGLRDRERGAALVKAGFSRTNNSRHFGGFALDYAVLYPIDNTEGRLWQPGFLWNDYPEVARAFGQAGVDDDIPVEWGACWSRIDIDGITAAQLNEKSAGYVRDWRRKNPKLVAAGKGPLVDGPHIQLPHALYPDPKPLTY